jgi:hypothetical protein
MVTSLMDAHIFSKLISADQKLIRNLGVLAGPLDILTSQSQLDFQGFMSKSKNQIVVSIAMEIIKSIIVPDPYLVLAYYSITIFIVKIDTSNFGIRETLYHQ